MLDFIIYNIRELDKYNMQLRIHIVVVDDGSTDKTPLIAKEYSRKYSNIVSCIILKHSHVYDSSIGLVRAVRAGLRYLERKGVKWDFFMQVDADTILLPGYIRNVMSPIIKQNEIGIAGGVTVNEPHTMLHVRNTGMVVRREVWEECGGYRSFQSPDTILQLCSIAHGWRIALVRTAQMIVLRPTRLNVFRVGIVDAVTGLSAIYASVKAIKLMLSRRNIKNMVYYYSGYICGKINLKYYGELGWLTPYRRTIEKIRIREIIKKFYK